MKLWDRTGRIVYSDEPGLIGARYPLGAEELADFRGPEADAEVSDLSKPENRFERSFGKLLEVYVPVMTPGESPFATRSTTAPDSSRRAGGESSASSPS